MHWRIEGIVPEDIKESHLLSRRILTLICDQRYTMCDMERASRYFPVGNQLMRCTGNTLLTGYRHPLYAASLAEFGEPRELPSSGGWLLERTVPQFPDRDAMGCYPIFAASDWSGLSKDLG